MNAKLLGQKIARTFREDGLRAIFRQASLYLRKKRTTDDFDALYGTDTGGFEPLWKFQIHSPHARFGTHYKVTGEHELLDALNCLCEELSPFTFIDLGCGKGRTLLVASRLGFRRVIGVEFASELAAIARANLSRMKVANAFVLDCDAADFDFPDGPIVLYLYNPFSQEVMRKIVANLRQSRSQRIFVIYKNPAVAGVIFDSSG